jgi:hypothetical protein
MLWIKVSSAANIDVWEFSELELIQQAVMDLGAKISEELGN